MAVTGWIEEEDSEAGGGTLQRRSSDVMALLVLDLEDDESEIEREMRETEGEKREGTGFFNSARGRVGAKVSSSGRPRGHAALLDCDRSAMTGPARSTFPNFRN
jgi:hypothetical protein